jgi:hypothetical protein
VSGYFSSVFLQVSNRLPDTFISIFSSSAFFRSFFTTGGGGRGFAAIGTHPTAAARANGNHAAATDAIGSGDLKRDAAASYGGISKRFIYLSPKKEKSFMNYSRSVSVYD